jgi:hypothetical protein
MILLVTYDLKQPEGSYSRLFDVLKSKDNWAHYISSTWLVATNNDTATDLSKQLLPHIFKGDRLLVVELIPGYAGWLPRKAWDWMKKYGYADDD